MPGAAVGEPMRFQIDPAHSSVLFAVDHLGFSAVHGRFNEVSGSFRFDPEAPEDSSVTATIDATSVDTNHPRRDEVLRSSLFLDAQAHPEITFTSVDITRTGERTGDITGTLRLAGQEETVTLSTQFNGMGAHPFDSDLTVAGFTASTSLDRRAFGIDFGAPDIGTTVEVQINVEGLRE